MDKTRGVVYKSKPKAQGFEKTFLYHPELVEPSGPYPFTGSPGNVGMFLNRKKTGGNSFKVSPWVEVFDIAACAKGQAAQGRPCLGIGYRYHPSCMGYIEVSPVIDKIGSSSRFSINQLIYRFVGKEAQDAPAFPMQAVGFFV